ncbi:oral-facial-digital syndrome 1 protein-like isoform X2 [Patiria miniata]|nr:oral-facial-digital syndrome 1 protein-like isoform X2 [Patiria miniata]XP_038055402.1 oral-facial-digital syndrome 1 protein-like isoform X2 [Patiria miniata]
MAELQTDSNCMTAEELKTKLYHSFRQKGLVDSLKSQLRTKLVNELRVSYNSQPTPSSPETVQDDECGTLMHRAANSLVADHLRRCQYEYTLAVFLPESETGKDKMFTIRELLGMLFIHPDSQLFRRVTENVRGYHPKGLLWQLLCELTSHRGKSFDKAVQVDNLPAQSNSIEKKLTAVDVLFDQEVDGYHESSQGMQAKLLSLQRKMELRTKEEITREIGRFKESEGKRIELEEREKCRQEIYKARREMESTYQAKLKALQERERSTIERIQCHQEMVERETYSQRQSLLDELQTLKQKEVELKREDELHKRAMCLEESRWKTTEENLKIREASIATIEETYEKRFKEQIRQHDAEQQVKLAERIQDIEKRETRIREDQNHLVQEKELQSNLKEELKERKSRIAELEVLYQQSKFEGVAVGKRNELFAEKLKDMMDYHSVKEDNAVLRRELQNEKRRLAEVINEQKMERTRHEEALAVITEKMSQPSPQILTLQAELQRAKSQLDQERNLLQHKEAQYRATLQEEHERNNELRRQLEEQGNQMREMNNQIADLRQTLRQTQMALSNEVYRKGTTGVAAGSIRSPASIVEHPVHDHIEPDNHYIDTTLHQTHIEQQLLLADQGGFGPITGLDSDNSDLSPNASLAFLEDTKARFKQLEIEAESLEQNYQNFQHRVTNINALPISPPLHTHQLRHITPAVNNTHDVSSWSKQVCTDKGPVQNQAMKPPPLVDGTTSQIHSQSEVQRTEPLSPRGVQDSPSSKGSSTPSDKLVCVEDLHEQNNLSKKSVSSVGSFKGSSQLSPHASPKSLKPTQPSATVYDDVLASLLPPPSSPVFTSPLASISDGESLAELLSKDADGENGPDVKVIKSQGVTDEELRLGKEDDEEREEHEWEEKRKKRDEERQLREQEAREREQAMLLELQRQEQGADPTTQQKAVEKDDGKADSDQKERVGPPGESGQEQKTEDEGLKIDPVMQRYMQMLQEKKQQDPQDRKASVVSTYSDAAFNVEHEMEAAEEPNSTSHVSNDSEDPFDDW